MDFLTRSELYRIALKYLDENFINKDGLVFISDIFLSTTNAIDVYEQKIKESKELSSELFWSNYEEKITQLPDDLRAHLEKKFELKERSKIYASQKKAKTYNQLFAAYLNCVADFQNQIIKKRFWRINGDGFFSTHKENQVFLSYAYDDQALSLALFIYFASHGIFLYVDWMQSGKNKTGKLTKTQLENALTNSNQFLFLRTATSELRIPGRGYSVRQWCAWEIGNFYSKIPNEKYIISFYESGSRNNIFLDSFKIMKGIKDGCIY